MKTAPVESFEEAAQRFPGLEQLEPQAIGRFVFFSAGHFPEELYQAEQENNGWHDNESQREGWHDEVSGIISDVQEWRQTQATTGITRLELVKSAQERAVLNHETAQLVAMLDEADPDTGFDAVTDYLDKWDFQVGTRLAPSPMFPEGRLIKKPAATYIDHEERYSRIPYGSEVFRDGVRGWEDVVSHEGEPLDERVKAYLDTEHAKLKVKVRLREGFEHLQPVDDERLQALREKFGAKAANLITLKTKLESFYEAVGEEDGVQKIEIPPFHAVAIDMYETWLAHDSAFEAMLENVRQTAIGLASQAEGGLVAIRSSAVYSEDGTERTGAGIYRSVVVDPNDPQAFAEGVLDVYISTVSADALNYQEAYGVSGERMGLLLQTYIEETDDKMTKKAYGFINSRGVNKSLIEAHTPLGTVLFDKLKLAPSLMLDRWHDGGDYLHAQPDHSKELRHMPNQIIAAVHAAIFAEIIFQTSVQVEYVPNGRVVQVRPLPRRMLEHVEAGISFPDNLQEIVKTKVIGTGDVVLEELDERDDNSDKEGFVIFWSEYGFTDSFSRSHQGLDSLPRKGAVIILNHSESGHIQTLCQEKGLMCFYPDGKGDELDQLKDYLDDTRDDYLTDEPDDFETIPEPTPRKLRLVADGYDGRIYKSESNEQSPASETTSP